jgi:PKD repeat protein
MILYVGFTYYECRRLVMSARFAFVVAAIVVLAAVCTGCKEDKTYLIVGNNAPAVNPIPDQAAPVNVPFSLDMTPYVSDDRDALIDLTFTVTTGLGSFTGHTYDNTFTIEGAATVYFDVSDTTGKTTSGSFNMVVYTPPLAEFVADVTSGSPPLTVNFTSLSTGTIDAYSWDFDGDGVEDSALQDPTHIYDIAGSYTVSLTVTCAGGSDTETKVDYITVTPIPPTADFIADVTQGTATLGVGFTDMSSGDIDTWSWDFGDMGTSTAQDPSHDYTAPGWYTVILTVSGPGGTDTMTKYAYIQVYNSVWYVDANYAYTTGSGTTPGDPFQEIWSGVYNATDYDLVLVADGSYDGASNNNLDFNGKSIAVRASGSNCTINGLDSDRAFIFQSGETNDAVLDGFIILEGASADAGGGIRCIDSSPTIVNCTFMANSAAAAGGGIAFTGACTPIVNNCYFQLNDVDSGAGGAIYCASGAVPTIEDCSFFFNIAGNSGPGVGGALYLEAVTGAVIEGCVFETNIAPLFGGAICATAMSDFSLSNCEIAGSICLVQGGGIYVYDSVLAMSNCEVTGGAAAIGGGIYTDGAGTVLEINDSSILRNNATNGGAGICSLYAVATLQDTTISSNTLETTPDTAFGGGIFAAGGHWTLTNCTINSNTCGSSDAEAVGAGIMFSTLTSVTATMTDCTVSMNRARSRTTSAGGGIAAGGADLTLTNCTVSGNYCSGGLAYGGGLAVEAPVKMVATGCVFNANAADSYAVVYGGGVALGAGGAADVTFSDCEISANSAFLFCNGGVCFGGGVYSEVAEATLSNCLVSDNTAYTVTLGGMAVAGGAGLCCQGTELLLADSTFSRNTAKAVEGVAAGGGIVFSNTTSATIIGCEISGNAVRTDSSTSSATALGGGLFLEEAAAGFSNCAVTGNTCMVSVNIAAPPGNVYGGGVYAGGSSGQNVTMANCLIAGNMTLVAGGGIYCADSINVDLTNCTIAENHGLLAGGGLYIDAAVLQATLTNCILWGNTGAVMGGRQLFTNGPADLYSCDYSDGSDDIGGGGSFSPDGNCINKNPLFVLGPNGEYYLSQIAAGQLADSPCVDAGAGTAASLGLDTKTTRFDEVEDAGTVDMGYHYDP